MSSYDRPSQWRKTRAAHSQFGRRVFPQQREKHLPRVLPGRQLVLVNDGVSPNVPDDVVGRVAVKPGAAQVSLHTSSVLGDELRP